MAFSGAFPSLRPAWAFSLAGAAVVANVALDHYCAPQGLLFAPLVAAVVTWLLVSFGPFRSLYLQTSCCAALVSLQDVGFKLTGGGEHDLEGQGALNVLFVLGAALAVGVLLRHFWRHPTHTRRHRTGALLVFALLIGLHLALFGWLGQGTSHAM